MAKLGKRLQKLSELVTTNYEHIWDCCCDHGLLGASILEKGLVQQFTNTIHFVDIVPDLMAELNLKLNQFYPQFKSLNINHSKTSNKQQTQWQTHCLDVKALPLNIFQGRHLVIIAGVGGDLTSDFVKSLCNKHPKLEIDFLLCPVHHQYSLRQQLIDLNLTLKQEVLIEENKRFYEALLVSSQAQTTIKTLSKTGKHIWQTSNQQEFNSATKYLSKTLQHYNRIQNGGREDVSEIIADYEDVSVFKV